MRYFGYVGLSTGFGFLVLLAFVVLKWFQIPAGNVIDWLIGAASFWWLIVIVTVPWNVYFEAQSVIAEAAISQENKIRVNPQQLAYVQKIRRLSLMVAIALHLFSAIGLYALAAFGISAVGYVSSAATLLLSGLRPAVRTYQYLAERLYQIRQQVKYPREDVLSLRDRVEQIENRLLSLENTLDLSKNDSWGSILQQQSQTNRQNLAHLQASLEQIQAKNAIEHQQILEQAQNAIAQLNEDSRLLQQVRDIIRFFKTA